MHNQRAPNINCRSIVFVFFFFAGFQKPDRSNNNVPPNIITSLTHIHIIWLVYLTGRDSHKQTFRPFLSFSRLRAGPENGPILIA